MEDSSFFRHMVAMAPLRVELEITESALFEDINLFREMLEKLRNFGFKILMDDFGTGYSNLGYLKQLNIDEIKIDRVFVSGIEKDTYNHFLQFFIFKP